MRRMTIIVAGPDPARLHAALSLAAAEAALGRPARLFLQPEATPLLRLPVEAPQDARYAAAGLPGLRSLIGEALAMGVEITVCQSGLALAAMDAEMLPEGVETGGLVELLSGAADDRLLIA